MTTMNAINYAVKIFMCLLFASTGVMANILAEQDIPGCPTPENFPHGFVFLNEEEKLNLEDGSGLVDPDSSLTFHCQKGYELIGAKIVICLKDGDWGTEFPHCTKKTVCPDPGTPRNGTRHQEPASNDGRFYEGTQVRVICDEGFDLIGSASIVCGRDGSWNSTRGNCKQIAVCPDPGTPRNGTRHQEPASNGGRFYAGTQVRVICDEGYDLIGSASIVCGRDGSWNSTRGKCKPKETCPDLPVETNGFYTVQCVGRSDFYFIHDVVKLSCNPGYKPQSQIGFKTTIYCDDDATWNWNMTTCRRITCWSHKLQVYRHLKEYDYNKGLRLRIPPGYQILGPNWNRCTDKDWLLSFPEIKKITCPDPGTPEDGSRTGPSEKFLINATVYFDCLKGHTMTGSKQRTCRSNGQWDGKLTTCSKNTGDCMNLGIPINGNRTGNSFKIGDTVTFECQPQLTLSGSATRVCLEDGLWSGTDTLCRGKFDFDRNEDVQFRLLIALDRKLVWKDSESPSSNTSEKDISIKNSAHHLVFYFIFDNSISVGRQNLRTCTKFAEAVIKRVGVSSTAHIGAVTYGKTIERILFPLGNINEKGVIKRLKEIREIGGDSSMAPALSDVLEMVKKVNEAEPEWRINSTIFLITNGMHTIGGDPVSRSSLLKEAGVQIYVVGLVGIETNVSTQIFQSLATSPKHVFYANGFETLEYLGKDLLKNTNDVFRCGLVRRDESIFRIWGGIVSKHHWPWMAFYFTTPGKALCGGSVIDNSWILTAAHCLAHATKEQQDNVVITVGTKNLYDQSKDVQRRKISRIWIHPSYVGKSKYGVPKFDAALIKLDSPLKYGKYVRRICLPPADNDISAQSLLYANGQSATVIGFGKYDDTGEPSENLREVNITILNDNVCQKSVNPEYKNYMSDSTICSMVPEGGNDAGQGDSGGPLMQSLEDSSKASSSYWVQVGIVSWGVPASRGGVPGGLSFYTNVAKVVGWIEDVVSETIP